jgi:radical SAM superfamily enzyme YgiQ (UPF0313 family)
MKILLIDPPYDRLQGCKTTQNYSLGPAYLASYLNKKGHTAIYLNLDWDPELPAVNPFSYKDLIRRYDIYLKETERESRHPVWLEFIEALQYFKPDLVGITTNSIKIRSAFRLIEIVKQIDKHIITVFGGHHSQIFAKEILENKEELDFVILDEGEETLLELINELGGGPGLNFGSIEGLVYRRNDRDIIFNKRRALINNLDAIPYPSCCHYYAKGKFIRIPILAVMASRGCPYNCNYCATNNIWQRKVRWRSPQNVVDEIKSFIVNQKERFLSFYDDCFTLNKKWLSEFCDIVIKENLKINWQCITSANLLDEAVFKKITQAGCKKINIGVESGSERILKIAQKNINLNVIRKVFSLAKKYNISTTAYIMIGFPTETEYDVQLTQDIIKEIRPNWVYCNILIPLPGTVFYNWCIERNLIDPKNAWRSGITKNIAMNFTNTISDEKFFKLVNRTFMLCYKINSNIINLFKRAPIRHYILNPFLAFADMRRGIQYVKRRGQNSDS